MKMRARNRRNSTIGMSTRSSELYAKEIAKKNNNMALPILTGVVYAPKKVEMNREQFAD